MSVGHAFHHCFPKIKQLLLCDLTYIHKEMKSFPQMRCVYRFFFLNLSKYKFFLSASSTVFFLSVNFWSHFNSLRKLVPHHKCLITPSLTFETCTSNKARSLDQRELQTDDFFMIKSEINCNAKMIWLFTKYTLLMVSYMKFLKITEKTS